MSGDVLSNYVEQVSALLQERLRIKGRTLTRQVSKLGRRVPRKIKKDAAFLAQANALQEHPKLAQMVDQAQVVRAGDAVIAHLRSIDPRDVMIDKILRLLAKISALGIAIVIAVIWYLWDQGLI